MKSYKDIPGWMDFEWVYDLALSRVPDKGILIEIGAWMGMSAAYMASRIRDLDKDVTFYVVDPFDGSGDPESVGYYSQFDGDLLEAFAKNMHDLGLESYCQVKAMTSEKAVKLFEDESVDFVFLDGDHSLEAVKMDLRMWWPKIKPGGYLGGHDLARRPGVTAAVSYFKSREGLSSLFENSYLFTKQEES